MAALVATIACGSAGRRTATDRARTPIARTTSAWPCSSSSSIRKRRPPSATRCGLDASLAHRARQPEPCPALRAGPRGRRARGARPPPAAIVLRSRPTSSGSSRARRTGPRTRWLLSSECGRSTPATSARRSTSARSTCEERRYDDAIAVLRAAVADEPYNVTAAYNLGLALTRAGQRDEGQQMLEARRRRFAPDRVRRRVRHRVSRAGSLRRGPRVDRRRSRIWSTPATSHARFTPVALGAAASASRGRLSCRSVAASAADSQPRPASAMLGGRSLAEV